MGKLTNKFDLLINFTMDNLIMNSLIIGKWTKFSLTILNLTS
jgi:hypothetical protein